MRLSFARAFCVLLAFILLPQANAGTVAIVLSENTGPYGEFAQAFEQRISASAWKISATGKLEGTAPSPRPDLIIAVGSSALRAALAQGGNTPILATLLPRHAYESIVADSARPRPRGTTSAIYLDQPAARLAVFIRHLLPTYQRIGLLSSAEASDELPTLRRAMGRLILDSEPISDDGALLPGVNNLLPRVNLLLALPDSTIYKRDNIKPILVSSFRHQRPVIAFSKAFVNAGALAALYSTPEQIAQQAGDWLLKQSGTTISLPPAQPPEQFSISINPSVADAYNLTLPTEASLYRAIKAEGTSK